MATAQGTNYPLSFFFALQKSKLTFYDIMLPANSNFLLRQWRGKVRSGGSKLSTFFFTLQSLNRGGSLWISYYSPYCLCAFLHRYLGNAKGFCPLPPKTFILNTSTINFQTIHEINSFSFFYYFPREILEFCGTILVMYKIAPFRDLINYQILYWKIKVRASES